MAEEDHGEFVFEGKLEASTVYEWVKDYHSVNSTSDENVQHPKLKPKLRSYQEKAVRWMIARETRDESAVRIVNDGDKLVHLEKGGILADEMGLGKTVEVLACLLANPNKEFKQQHKEYIDNMKADLMTYENADTKNGDVNSEVQEVSDGEPRRPKRQILVKENVDNNEMIVDDAVVVQDEGTNSCQTKQKSAKSVYNEILDDTLFEKGDNSGGNEDVRQNENVCNNEDVRQNENVCNNEVVRQNENVCNNEVVRQNENVCNNEVVRQNENVRNNEVVRQNENVRNNEVVRQNENVRNNEVVRQNENVCNNEVVRQNENVRKRNVVMSLGETVSKCCLRLIADFNPQNWVRQDGDKGGCNGAELSRSVEAICEEEEEEEEEEREGMVVAGRLAKEKEEREGMVVAGRLAKEMVEKRRMEEVGGGIDKDGGEEIVENIAREACGRKRSRKSVAPKRKIVEDDDDDADFLFKSSSDSTLSSRKSAGKPRQKKRKIKDDFDVDDDDDDDDTDFVYKSSSDYLPSSSRKSTRRKRKVICDDLDEDFNDVDDPPVMLAPPRKSRAKAAVSKMDVDPDFEPAKKKRAKSAKSSLLRAELQKMYEALLSETSPAVKQEKIARLKAESDYRCCCLDPTTMTDQVSVKCPICRKLQHPDCVGFEPSTPYVCFTCWPQRALVPTNATLIVSPGSIAGQWSDEIKKHLMDSDLKVLIYDGVRSNGYQQPLELAQYDIVITSYQVLLKEIDYVNEDPGSQKRNMRYARKFFPPTSPLTCVKWWRICLDEAQMVECVTSKIYFMVSALQTVNRWAVCGTPIQRQVSDLFGLVAFLQVDPYGTCKKSWQQLEDNREALAEFLPQVMWRTSKCHVLHELNVPPQKVLSHWLAFSPVETFFYRKQHAQCSSLFRQKAQQLLPMHPLTTPLCHLPSKQLSALLAPLLRLRQACLHPQLIRGQFVAIKHTLTMGELLAQMVTKASTDSEEALRQLVASLNGVAGVQLLTGESLAAVDNYRRVMHLAQEYDGRLKMDTLQKIHTMHNLATALQSGRVTGAAPTLRDGTLLDDVKALEEEYLRKRLGDVKGNKSALLALDKQYADKHGGRIGGCDWWSDMLRAVDSQELLHKIQIEFEHAKGPLMAMLKKMSGILALMEELYQWQQKIDETRKSIIDQIKQLEDMPTSVMAGHANNCHLRNKRPPHVNKRCLICRIEHELKQYESLLFWIMNKEDSKSTSKVQDGQQPETSAAGGQNQNQKSIANLENNTIFEVYNVGTWKPSQHEQILRLISNSCSKRLMKREWTDESQNQFGALDILRKEFRRLRLLWSQISDQVAASDELAMAKLRLRLATTEEYLAEERKRKPALKSKETEKRNVICPLQVDMVLEQLKAEVAVNESALKKSAGTLYYLQNLQKNGDKQNEPCPICRNQLTDSWSVLKCGHCYCYDCIHTLTNSFNREAITCPVCRENTNTADVSHIEGRDNIHQMAAEVKGSYTTKIQAMVAEVICLRAADPEVKVLMFSVWDGVLDVLGEALAANDIVYCRLSSHAKKRDTVLKTFKTKRDVCALLMPLRSGAKGLNLVEATHVFLAEPILNPAEEQQAVGRVHRIGQTRETFVHRFSVKGTIEEKMLTAMEGSNNSQWSKDKVTIQQLLDLFVPVEQIL